MRRKVILSVIVGLLILVYVAVACAPPVSDGTSLSSTKGAISYVENEYLLFKYEDMDTGYTCYIATTPNSASALQLVCVK